MMDFDEAAFAACPEHMMIALKIISYASSLEYWIYSIIVELVPERAVEMATHLTALTAESKKTASIDGAITALLPADKRAIYERLKVNLKQTNALRNPFAHCRFGHLIHKPDALVVIDPRVEVMDRAKRIQLDGSLASRTPEHMKKGGEIVRESQKKTYYYTLAELNKILDRVRLAERNLMDFWHLTGNRDLDPAHYDTVLKRLEADLP